MANQVSHFEIHADDLPRAAKFYTDVFGWEIKKWDSPDMDYWMVMTCPRETPGGINGGLVKRMGKTPEAGTGMNGFACTVTVDDFDATAAKIIAAGGKEALSKFNIAGMAWQGYFLDSEMNCFGIHQPIKQ